MTEDQVEVEPDNSGHWDISSEEVLSMDDIYFLWKIYCDSINIPLIMNKKEFETLDKSKI